MNQQNKIENHTKNNTNYKIQEKRSKTKSKQDKKTDKEQKHQQKLTKSISETESDNEINRSTSLSAKKINHEVISNRSHSNSSNKTKTITNVIITDYQSLLPDYLNAKFPQQLSELARIAQKLDAYLFSLPQQPNRKNKRDSFSNIQSYFAKIEEMNVELTHLEQINYIQTNLYKFYLDPLKNLVVEYPTKENIHIRQKTFKELLYKHLIKSMKDNTHTSPLPAKQLLTKRISCQYQPKKFTQTHSKTINSLQIKQQFIDKIINKVKQLQEKHRQLESQSKLKVKKQQINFFKKEIELIYQQQKVNNIFKATLVELLGSKTKTSIEIVLKGLNILLSKNENIKEIIIKQRSIINYQ